MDMDYVLAKSVQDKNITNDLQRDFQIVNRALRVLSACTQAVIRAVDEKTLLQKLVQLITDEAAYRMAWIGYACYDAAKSVKPMAWAGYESDYLKTINLTWDNESPRGQGPTGKAIRSGQPVACQNMLEDPQFEPWREAAQQRGYQSSLVLPLLNHGSVFGCLNIYSGESGAFNQREVELLQELSDSLSFGIVSLRTKQERQQAEIELRMSEEKFSKVFYGSPIAKVIARVDDERYIVDVNHSFERLFGFDRSEVVGHNSFQLKILRSLSDRQKMLEIFDADGKLVNYEVPLYSRNGDIIICHVSAELIQIGDKTCRLFVIVDITEQKQAELMILRLNEELEQRVKDRTAELTQATEQLRLTNQELLRSNQELEQFAYVASHDLQEPLRAVMGYTQLLMSEYGDRFDDIANSYAEYVIDGSKRMQQLIHDLLAYSRVSTRGKEFAPTDCNALVQAAMRNLQLAIAEKNAEIIIEPLPVVNGDRSQLVQLFQNLIGNAIKFCKAEQPRIYICATKVEVPTDLEGKEQTSHYLFEVRDNGIGIKSQYLDRIFEVFKRLHTRREYDGTGIGLAICKKIVLRHGGQIWAESIPNVGTTFFFTV
jgi:PAS domain S-box-containing protein